MKPGRAYIKFSLTVLCAVLCAAPLSANAQPPSHAAKNDFARILTEDNIRDFLEEIRAVSIGQNYGLTADDIEIYLKRHLADEGSFNSKTTYEIPGYPVQDVDMDYDKENFIVNVLDGRGLMKDFETSVDIQEIKINGNGRAATVRAAITEQGMMPWPDGKGGQEMIPIRGSSDCDQKLVISLSNYIQLADAQCTTTISFNPFTKPLGE